MNPTKITNYVTMRKATQEEIDKFVDYRANHIALVRRLGRVLFDLDLSEHDKDKIECDAIILNHAYFPVLEEMEGYENISSEIREIDVKKIEVVIEETVVDGISKLQDKNVYKSM